MRVYSPVTSYGGAVVLSLRHDIAAQDQQLHLKQSLSQSNRLLANMTVIEALKDAVGLGDGSSTGTLTLCT
jgi:hypothetical protein